MTMKFLINLRDNIVNFFRGLKNKKLFKRIDPISFALVVLLGASAVFAGIQLVNQGSLNETVMNPSKGDGDVIYTDDTALVNNPADTADKAALSEVVLSPVSTDEVQVTKYYYSDSVDTTVQTQSFFYYPVGQSMYSHESKGMSFKGTTDEPVNVVASLSGTVLSVKDEILKGTVVTIEHANDVKTVYTGVYDVKVSVGDKVSQGAILGTTGLSQLEPDAGNVVHFEIIKGDEKIDPQTVIDKKLSDL